VIVDFVRFFAVFIIIHYCSAYLAYFQQRLSTSLALSLLLPCCNGAGALFSLPRRISAVRRALRRIAACHILRILPAIHRWRAPWFGGIRGCLRAAFIPLLLPPVLAANCNASRISRLIPYRF
jgi:hypothetical protein